MKTALFVAMLPVVMAANVGLAQNRAGTRPGAVGEEQIQNWTNIFSRYRQTSGRVVGPGGLSSAPVFIGVVMQDDSYVGLLQVSDGRGGSDVVSVKPGDVIAWDNSRVSQVSWESLYLQGGSRSHEVVQLGHDLENISKIPPAGPIYHPLDETTAGGNGPTGRNNAPAGSRPLTPPTPSATPAGRNPRSNGLRNGGPAGSNRLGVNGPGLRSGRSGGNGAFAITPAGSPTPPPPAAVSPGQ